MRRLNRILLLLVALSFTSCLSRPAWHGETPSVPSRGRATPLTTPCREVSRQRCDIGRCKGPNMDWIELQCAGGGRTNRCVITRGCAVGD